MLIKLGIDVKYLLIIGLMGVWFVSVSGFCVLTFIGMFIMVLFLE